MQRKSTIASDSTQAHSPNLPGKISNSGNTVFRFDTPLLRALCAGDISKSGFLIVQMVLSFGAKGNVCWASNSYISNALGISIGAVKNEVTKLVRDGYLDRPEHGNRRVLVVGTVIKNMTADSTRHKKYDQKRASKLPDQEKIQGNATDAKRVIASHHAFGDGIEYDAVPVGDRSVDDLVPSKASRKDRVAPKTEPVDAELSDVLRTYVKERGWDVSRSPKKWVQAFASLRRMYGAAEVRRRLDAYIRLRTDRPRIRNGQELAHHWIWVGDAIDKGAKTQPLPAETITPETKWVLSELRMLDWSFAKENQLPSAVQRSMTNHRAFAKRLWAAALTGELKQLRNQLRWVLGDTETAVLDWWKRQHDRLKAWTEFSGDLHRYVWACDQADFVRAVERKLTEYGAADGSWARLLAAVDRPEKDAT